MKVNVTMESENPATGRDGRYWVCRTVDGWHNYCGVHYAKTAAKSIFLMYHANEVDSVTEIDAEHATAEIAE